MKKLNACDQELQKASPQMDIKQLLSKLDELNQMAEYILKLTSEIRATISVSTEVLKREPVDYTLKAQVRAKFFAKHKAGVSYKP